MRSIRRSGVCAALILIPFAANAADSTQAPPKLRLDSTARPIQYVVDVTVRPESDTFQGRIAIDLQLNRRTDLLWLNGTGIKVRTARFDSGRGAIAARPVKGGQDFLGFRFARPVGPARGRFTVDYSGKVSATDSVGIFRRKVD